jgi:hypothetical protein
MIPSKRRFRRSKTKKTEGICSKQAIGTMPHPLWRAKVDRPIKGNNEVGTAYCRRHMTNTAAGHDPNLVIWQLLHAIQRRLALNYSSIAMPPNPETLLDVRARRKAQSLLKHHIGFI